MRPAWQDREDDIYLRMSGSVPDPDEAFHERMALRDEVARHAPADCSLAEIDATVRQLSGGRFFTAPPGEGLSPVELLGAPPRPTDPAVPEPSSSDTTPTLEGDDTR